MDMTAQQFTRELTVTADARRCWDVLTDVVRLATWVDVVQDVEELSRLEKYRAVLQDRLGPFKLRAELDIAVDVVTAGTHVQIRATGQDRQVGSQIAVTGTLRLAETATGGTTVAVTGSYEVTGRVATMGSGVIRKKADKILAEFFANAERELATG
jgi:carbon monoxide dehydrogenase subunit G